MVQDTVQEILSVNSMFNYIKYIDVGRKVLVSYIKVANDLTHRTQVGVFTEKLLSMIYFSPSQTSRKVFMMISGTTALTSFR